MAHAACPHIRRIPYGRALATIAGLLTLVSAMTIAIAARDSPTVGHLAARVRTLAGPGAGDPLDLDNVAPVMRQAIVADEDERFYHHDGIDVLGALRAVPYDIVHLSARQGASTITQQLAKLAYLGGNDHSPWRKLEDAVLAIRLEDRYSKAQILGAYLDGAYFGQGATGIAAAATRYFGANPRDLTLAQASLLAGLVQAPSADDPFDHPDAARSRQVQTLRSMVRIGAVTEREAAAVLRQPLPLARSHRVLPAVHESNLDPGPPFRWGDLATSLLLIALSAVAIAWARRRAPAPRLLGFALAVPVLLAGLAGASDPSGSRDGRTSHRRTRMGSRSPAVTDLGGRRRGPTRRVGAAIRGKTSRRSASAIAPSATRTL